MTAAGPVCGGYTDPAIDRSVERTRGKLAVDRKLPVERSLRCYSQSSRSLVRDNEAFQTDQIDQGCAIVRIQASRHVHLRCRQRGEIVDPPGIAGDTGIALQRDQEGPGTAVDLELGGRIGAAVTGCGRIERERPAQRNRAQAPSQAAKLLRRLRSKLLEQYRHALERARIEVERHGATRRWSPRIDAALGRQRHAADIGDGQLVDLETVGIDPHSHVGLLDLDAAEHGTADLQRQGAFARSVEIGVAQDRLCDRLNTVDIELGRRQCGFDAGRSVAAGPGIGQASEHGHAVDFRIETIDGDPLAVQREIAAQAE